MSTKAQRILKRPTARARRLLGGLKPEPCPHCESPASYSWSDGRHSVQCGNDDCAALMSSNFFYRDDQKITKAGIITRWNRRSGKR